MNGKQILELEMGLNDPGATTIRSYLIMLLAELFQKEEAFCGKRPFGNSGWKYELYRPLINAGILKGKIEDDDIVEVDKSEAEFLFGLAINALLTD